MKSKQTLYDFSQKFSKSVFKNLSKSWIWKTLASSDLIFKLYFFMTISYSYNSALKIRWFLFNSSTALIQPYNRGKFWVTNLWQTDWFITLWKWRILDEKIVKNSLENIQILTFKKQYSKLSKELYNYNQH